MKKILSAFAAIYLLAQPASAQEDVAVNSTFGAWRIACEAITVTQNVCRLVQEQTLAENNALVLRLIAMPAAENGLLLFAQVPMGVHLPGGAVYRPETPEDAEQTQMIWQRCGGNVCEAALSLDADQVADLATAGDLLFGYSISPQSEPIVTRVPMEQFSDGLSALRASVASE